MRQLTCVVLGGGFAGIHAMKSIHQAFQSNKERIQLQLIVIDKLEAHLRKVLLFQPAASGEPISVPWQQLLPADAAFIQGTVTGIDHQLNLLHYEDIEGKQQLQAFDMLVVAIGSVAEKPAAELGGIALADLESASRIRSQWMHNLQQAADTAHSFEKARLMSVAIAGAGITGVETAAELAYAMKQEAQQLGLNPEEIHVHLLNAKARLFQEGPAKVADKVERTLAACGVTVHHQLKALQAADDHVHVSDGQRLPVGLTIWTLGLRPNSMLMNLSLPLTADGQVQVDSSYRVIGTNGVYSIGDCAHIVDPVTGMKDAMTCKEAIPQAQRLGSILYADATGRSASQHKSVLPSFTIGLGPERGVMWTRKWGLDMIVTGKLAYRIKVFLWNYASLLRG